MIHLRLFALVLFLVCGSWCLASGSALRAQATVSASGVPASTSGAELYRSACASCHGADGRGLPQATVAFAIPIPDFTSCTFATREPDEDWGAIIHTGGPVRAFDRMMPAFGEALSWEQIESILEHVRTFCTDAAWPRGELNLPRALVTEKAFPENEAVWTTTVTTEGDDSIANKLIYEKRFGARNQVELVLPIALVEAGGDGWDVGLGDVAVAVKRAIYHSGDRGRIFSLTGEVVLPTGDEDRGFGKGTTVFEPFATFGQIFADGSFLQAQGGLDSPSTTAMTRPSCAPPTARPSCLDGLDALGPRWSSCSAPAS